VQPRSGSGSSESDEPSSQRAGGLIEIPALLREFGVDSAEVLTRVGLPATALDHIDNRIAFTAVDALLGECVARTGCAHFGLLVGSCWGLSHFGVLGQLMQHSRTVGEALRSLTVYQHLHSDSGAVFLLEHKAAISLGYAIYRKDVRHPDHIYDAAMAIACNLLRELCGSYWAPSEVVLSRASPVDEAPYRQHLRAPLRFDRAHSAVRFPAHWLKRALPHADPERRRAVAAALEAKDSGRLVFRLHRALRLLLLTGKSAGDDLAHTLSLHRRTLSRRLRAQGTTFQKVLDEVRLEVARHLLERTRAPIDDIAAALCYSDVTAFTHAFRRWTGTTPALWRKTAGRR
jgi:AraC-like DNA-binding protein